MALDKIGSNGQTNETWRGVIDAGIDLLNSDVLQYGTILTITQSGGESTTQCVVSGHTSATFNASDYSNDAAQTINAAIESLPRNMSNHNIDIIVGTTGGQEITVSNQINIHNFDGGVVTVKSAKTADNGDDSSTKANKIVSAGTVIDRIFSINKCSECNIQGLELKENTGTQSSSYVVVVSTSWSDINHCKLTGGGTQDQQRAVLSQRGANVWLRDSWVDNVATGILINNSGIAAQTNCSWTGTQPITGMYAAKSIGFTDSSQNIQGSSNEYIAANGGLITNEQGLILEETILRQNKTVNFDNSMSVSDMQNIINDQPKNLNGYDITFQFADGTYDFDTSNLVFQEFEGGTINIWGDQSDVLASDGTGLGVKIQSENTGGSGAILVEKCSRVGVKKIAFEQNGSNTDTDLLNIRYASDAVVQSCSFNSLNGTTTNDGITITQATTFIINCGFNNLVYNIMGRENSRIFSKNTFTFSGGTDSDRNLRAESGSIMTQNNSQAGGGNSKAPNDGGVIFDSSGALV